MAPAANPANVRREGTRMDLPQAVSVSTTSAVTVGCVPLHDRGSAHLLLMSETAPGRRPGLLLEGREASVESIDDCVLKLERVNFAPLGG